MKLSKGMMPKAVLSGDWLPNGKFVVGDNLGAMYVCHQTKPLCRVHAHKGTLGALVVTKSGMVITGGNDGHMKTWTINATSTEAKMTFHTKEPISFADNDFEFLPRAIAYDEAT